ncbi:MAG: cytochrome c biogenesis protein ResB [Thermoleophilia bacterium]
MAERATTAQAGDRRPFVARWAREVWGIVTSAWVAVTVVPAFILVAIAGSMLPQASTTSTYALHQWQYEHAWISWWADPLGLFQAFSSWTFLAILIVLAVNLTSCTVDRTVRRTRAARGGARFGAAFAGSLVLHAGLLVVLAGGVVTAGWRFDATVVATEGQTVDIGKGEVVRMAVGPMAVADSTPPLAMALVRFRPVYEEGAPVALDSDLTLRGEGAGQRDVVVAVNRPVEVDGWRITQAGHGYSPAVVVVSPTGVVLVDAFVALESQRGGEEPTFSDRVGVPGMEGRLELSVLPDLIFEGGRARSASVEPRNPALRVTALAEDGSSVAEEVVPLGGEAGVLGYNVVFRDLRYWSAFRVVRDPGRWVVNAGFVVCLIGLLLRYISGYAVRWGPGRRKGAE